MEYMFKNLYKKISKVQKTLFISTVCFGIITHGYIFYNNLTYHDGIVSVNTFGYTYGLGRWFLGVLELFSHYFIGIYSPPAFLGFLSIFLIAISGMFVLSIFQIKNISSAVYIGGILVVFPAVASIFAYMYTSVMYWIAFLLYVVAAFFIVKYQDIKKLSISSVLIAFALGIYQAFFSVVVVVLLLSIIRDLLNENIVQMREIVKKGFWYLGTLFGGLTFYFVINGIVTALLHLDFVKYPGVEVGNAISFINMAGNILNAYISFLGLNWCGINEKPAIKLLVLFIFVMTIILFFFSLRKSSCKWMRLTLVVILTILPLGINVVYLIPSNSEYSVHTLMIYSTVFALIFPILLLDGAEKIEICGYRLCKTVLSILLWLLLICYSYLDNAAYFKMDFVTEQAMTYYTVLISEIKGTENYSDDMSIAYIGEFGSEDTSFFPYMDYWDKISIKGYEYSVYDLLNSYAWKDYMGRHCGFYPETVSDIDAISSMEVVRQMPCYPDDGSIQIIDNLIVVKFSNQ